MKDISFKDLKILANKYGFDTVWNFSNWVEDNDLADILGFEDDKDIDRESKRYKTKLLALEILSLPEVKERIRYLKDHNISIDNMTLKEWLEYSRKAKEIRYE